MSYFTIRNKAKFTISYIDDIEYCITNGQFTKHLSRNDIGLYWHANPQKYKSSDIIKYPKGKTLTAKEIWDRDSIKQKYAIEQGYELLIIWEHDYKKDKQKILQECCEWISKS